METTDILKREAININSIEQFRFQPDTLSHFEQSDSGLTIKEMETDKIFDKWVEYISTNKNSHVFNHPLWIKALENEYKRKATVLVSYDNLKNIRGLLPLLPTLGFPFKKDELVTSRRLSSLPRTPLGGLLFDNIKIKELLLQAAIEKVQTYKETILQLKSYESCLNKNINNLSRISWRSSYYLELPDDPEKIRFGNKEHNRKIKWSVNKAKNSGISLRTAETESDLKEWYKLYLEVMRWHAVAARPYRFFKYLFENFSANSMFRLLLAEQTFNGKGKIIAGSVFLYFNDTCFYSFNGRNKHGLFYHANDLIQWEAIHDACRRGFRIYDMGEVTQDKEGLAQFKSKWGCSSKPIYHYYYNTHFNFKDNEIDFVNDFNMVKHIYRKFPLLITELCGVLANRYL